MLVGAGVSTMPDSYALVYTEAARRIFVIVSPTHGKFVLTKECTGEGCGCIGCVLLAATIRTADDAFPVFNLDDGRQLQDRLLVYSFTEEGRAFVDALDRKRYVDYHGPISKADLDRLFERPNAVIFIGREDDGTFTHSFVSSTVEMRVISRGCRATKHCPCVGCRIVDMWYTEMPGHLVPTVDLSSRRATSDGKLVLPIFVDDSIISALLNRDPAIRHDFTPNIFESPLEKMFYELAFLDLHLYSQHSVGKYRLDFAIPDKMIAIELDGHEYHKTKYQRTHDAQRDRWLYGQGWHVLRFTGTEIYNNLDGCIDEICLLANVERLSLRR
jgi:very-short-patch-repair endonuclease